MFRKLLLLAALALFGAPALAAFPTVDGSEGTTISSTTTTHAVNVPGDACTSAQQLVLLFALSDAANTITDWNGFTQFGSASTVGSEKLWYAYKNCSGSEGATISITTSLSGKSQSVMFKISGDSGNQPTQATTNNGNDANPDPPNHTPAGGTQDYLWITAEANDDVVTTSSCPTNYTTNCASAGTSGGSGTTNVNLGWSWRTNNGSSEDPGTFALSGAESWDTTTMAVAPASTSAATFTSGPATVDIGQSTIEVSFTSDSNGTVKGTACANGDAGNAAETLAGQCSGGDGALATISQAVIATVVDGDTFTGLSAATTYDLGFVIDAAVDSSLASIADQTTDAADSSALTFFWRAEGTTLSADDDFSAGDTTATANGGVSISNTAERVGTNGILTTDAADYYSFTPTSIVNTAVGSFGCWVQATTAYTGGTSEICASAYGAAANNKISIVQDSSQEFQLRLRRDGQAAITLTTTTVNAAEDAWLFLVGRYDIAADDRRIEVYDTSLNLVQTREDLTTDLANAQMTETNDLRIGNAGTHASPIWVDNIFWSDEYDAPIQDFALIASYEPTFTASAVGNPTTTTIPITFTSDQDGTASWVACPNGQTASRAQVLAGNCSGGAAVASFSEPVDGGVADGGAFTGLTPNTVYDVFGEITSGIGAPTGTQASLANATTDAAASVSGITFFWRAEGTTLSSPDDFTAGDGTASASGSATISGTAARVGSNGILTVDGNDFFNFDSSSIVSETVGSFAGWLQWKTAVSTSGISGPIEVADTGQDDEISINPAASQEFQLRLRNDGTAFINLATTAVNATVDAWYYVVGRYDIPNDDRRLEVYDINLTLVEAVEDLTTDLSVQAPSGLDTLRFGNTGSHSSPIWVDNVFFSQAYDAPLQDYGLITSHKPTYTSGPSNGPFGTTTLNFSMVADQKGTTYAAACTNGQTVTSFANLKSGTCSGGAAVGTGTIELDAGVGDTVIITGLVAGTTYDVYIGHETNIGGQSDVASLADRTTTGGGGAVAFDTAPAVASQTTESYIIGYDANAAANDIFCGCYPETASAPTGAQIEAGTGATGTKTEATTGSADSLTLTCSESDKLPVHDLYCVLEDTGVGYSAVASLLDEFLDEPADRNYVAKFGVPTGDEEGLFEDASPAIATDDIMDVPELSDSHDIGGKAHILTVNTDSTFVIKRTHDAADVELPVPDDSRNRILRRFYDRSLAAWSDPSPVAYYVNNKFPRFVGPQNPETSNPFLYEKDAALDEALDDWWVDDEGDALTHEVVNMPPGGVLTSNETITGAFTTLGYYPGVEVVTQDIATDVAEETVEFVVGARIPPITWWLEDESNWKLRNIFEAVDPFNQLRRAELKEAA